MEEEAVAGVAASADEGKSDCDWPPPAPEVVVNPPAPFVSRGMASLIAPWGGVLAATLAMPRWVPPISTILGSPVTLQLVEELRLALLVVR